MNTSTLKEMLTDSVALSPWVHPSSGSERLYINASSYDARRGLELLLQGVKCDFFKTGNISSAEIWSEDAQEFIHISNSKAKALEDKLVSPYFDKNSEKWVGLENEDVINVLNELI